MTNQHQINRQNFAKRMEERSFLLLSSGSAPHKTTDQFYLYVPHKSFYYFTGIEEDNCTLLILRDGKNVYQYLFITETTEYMRQWIGEAISKEEASRLSGIPTKNIMYNSQLNDFILRRMTWLRGNPVRVPEYLYLDLLRPSTKLQPIAYKQFEDIINLYKELQIKNANEIISDLRMYKTEDEITKLQKAIDITEKGLNRIMKACLKRDTEQQVEADFNHEITLNGSKRTGFDTICASGGNATILHYEDNNQPLDKSGLLLCDLGAEYNNYSADITRTYPISGKFTERQKAVYDVVLKANKESIKFVKPGITWKELNDFAKNILIKGAKELGLIEEDAEISKYYYHSIGHFLGLDVHDVGQFGLPLKEGMVLTIEPGLYIKEEGIGVRIEDDILVTKEGCINLSKNIIKETDDIEAYMHK